MTATQLALTDAPTVDPDAGHRQTVRNAIRWTARTRGVVDPNHVRANLIGHDVPSHIVGQVYRAMRLAGELVPLGWVESDDVKGGNNGKPARTYTYRGTP